MPIIEVTTRDGRTKQLAGETGRSLMENLREGGIEEVLALCGGCCSCGTCHVYVADEWLGRLPPLGTCENDVLGFSDWREANSRLSCQIPLSEELDGLAVTVAPAD